MLQTFLKKHKPACPKNWICEALSLSSAIVKEKSSSPAKVAEGSQKWKHRNHDLSFIVHKLEADISDKGTIAYLYVTVCYSTYAAQCQMYIV